MSSSTQTLRKPGAIQGWTLASSNWLSVIATSAITPVLPFIAKYFASTPNLDYKLSLLSTIPALFVAICAFPAGWLADKIGGRKVLLIAVGLYGFMGCAPMVLNDLDAIIVTRAGVGILEAAIMTVTTSLVGDYFHGNDRERWLAVQTGGASVIATVTVIVCGMMGDSSWRLPFALYGFGFILFFLCVLFVWTPSDAEKHAVQAAHAALEAANGKKEAAGDDNFSWGTMIPIYAVSFYVATAFYVLLIQLGYILVERHYEIGATIGTVMAVMSVCMSLGAVIFKFMKAPVSGKMALSFALSGVGFFVVASSQQLMGVIIGSAITGLGSGMALPTMITYSISKLPGRVRARGMGIWQASFFVGQFASPLIIVFLKDNIGGLSNAVKAYSGFMAVAFVLAIVTMIKGGGKAALAEAE